MICPVYFNFNLPVSVQMSMDQTLFENIQAKKIPAFLRFYSMESPSVTVGYFSKKGNQSAIEAITKEFTVVKRPTGGGIVYHGSDLVFSFGADSKLFQHLKSTGSSYRWIHSMFQQGFKRKGISVQGVDEGDIKPKGQEVCRGLCFENPVAGDLTYEGRKVAGGAQKRQKNYFLHQGSISLSFSKNSSLDKTSFAEIIKTEFEKALAVQFEAQELTSHEQQRVDELSRTVYEPEGVRAA